MSPIDQAFLKAFANAGRASVAAAPHVLPVQSPSANPLAEPPKPAGVETARPRDAGPVVCPVARFESNAAPVSSLASSKSPASPRPHRITLSEAIALRESQRALSESASAWQTDSQHEADWLANTNQAAAVEPRPLEPESRTAATTASTAAATMAISVVESAPDEVSQASHSSVESVTEATAARLAQLTALWDATIAETNRTACEPLPTEASREQPVRNAALAPESLLGEDMRLQESCSLSMDGETESEQTTVAEVPGNDSGTGLPAEPARADETVEQFEQQVEPFEQSPGVEAAPQGSRPAEAVAAAPPSEQSCEAAPILRLLRPAVQLERFAWPSLTSRWMRGCGEQLDGVADALLRAVRSEQRIIGFSSCRPGEGVSSVVLATARRLSQRRCRFAVLEGNWDAPQFARRLALLSNDGWEAVIDGRRDLADVMVGADEGRAAVIPAMRAPSLKAEPARIAETYDLLRQNYELVLIDLPPRGCGTPHLGSLCDSIVLIQHPRQTRMRELQQYAAQWSSEGVSVLGVVQNGLN